MVLKSQKREEIVEELKKSALYLFSKKGKAFLKRNDFIYEPSLELGWFEPSKGKLFFQNLLKMNLLKEVGDQGYALNFKREEFFIPMDFRPDINLILIDLAMEREQKEEENLFKSMVKDMASKLSKGEKEILKEIEKVRSQMPLLEPEVCLLLYAREHQALKEKWIEKVFEKLISDSPFK